MSTRTSERPILTVAAIRAAEARVIAGGVPVATLMERAGAAVAEAAWRHAGPLPTLVLCGPGNNGGDGYVVARLLAERGMAVRVAASGEPRTDAARAAAALWHGPVEPLADATPAPLLIDALFGIGLTRPLDGGTGETLVRLAAAARRTVAVDVPSGVETDTGALLGPVPRFDLTVALGALKPAHRLLPAAGRCGRLAVAHIGLGRIMSELVEVGRPPRSGPDAAANKYSRGKLVVLAGAMPGAAALAAAAGQRAGAGYVELLGSSGDGVPHALVRRAWAPAALDDGRIGAIVVGPGLGRDRAARSRLDPALAAGKPLVVDADALTLLGRAGLRRLAMPTVLTPHEGEFARMFGKGGGSSLVRARAAAARAGVIVLLKGAASVVAHPDGRAAIAPIAPAWLATAGTGDVLAGIVGALMAGGLDPFAAGKAALWLHAEAARLAGPGLIADDLVAHIPAQ